MTTNMTGAQHAVRAAELLEQAEALLDTPRCHHAREYALVANGHATLALRALVAQTLKGEIPAQALLAALAEEPNPERPSTGFLRRWLKP